MSKENGPLLSDEFLDEVAKEINQLYGGPAKDENDVSTDDTK
ncbi:hypothetical protein J2S09_000279 [Bacillus fengqiuensis]|nr:hypothetical protein [Bacillus fengqiuensis]